MIAAVSIRALVALAVHSPIARYDKGCLAPCRAVRLRPQRSRRHNCIVRVASSRSPKTQGVDVPPGSGMGRGRPYLVAAERVCHCLVLVRTDSLMAASLDVLLAKRSVIATRLAENRRSGGCRRLSPVSCRNSSSELDQSSGTNDVATRNCATARARRVSAFLWNNGASLEPPPNEVGSTTCVRAAAPDDAVDGKRLGKAQLPSPRADIL